MAAKKFYAIAVGLLPGIYDNWPLAQAQVAGVKGAKYKGFATRAEAEAWLKNPVYAPAVKKDSAHKTATARVSVPKEGEVVIYTDGGALNNPGPGGYGVVQIYNGARKELSGGFRMTTNNRMELMACIVALKELEHRDKKVHIFSDSSYVVNGITKGWARSWRKRGWVKSDNQPAINPDLWGQLLDLVAQLDVCFNWVRGHSGDPLNERCDELAVATARQGDELPEDLGYQRGNGE
ncbi:MAG: ribonuclease HI [Desulfobulbaceae bacterium]|nr:ribonuclease HI [Desulfobulbaceae bacterium]HIJ78937.1 ribonuclease HI [Deltaproteobacteria bacterium]